MPLISGGQVMNLKERLKSKSGVPKEVYKHGSKLGAGAAKRRSMHLARPQKVGAVMGEFKRGTLHSGGGGVVKSRQQAIAIALSEARKRKK